MLGGWVNPHREQQTMPQGQTSIPPKSFSTPTANGQSAPRSGSARGVGRGAESFTLTQWHRWKETDGNVCSSFALSFRVRMYHGLHLLMTYITVGSCGKVLLGSQKQRNKALTPLTMKVNPKVCVRALRCRFMFGCSVTGLHLLMTTYRG